MSARAGMSVAALSRLTWTADDRRAWNEAYRTAVLITARRALVGTRAAIALERFQLARDRVLAGDVHSVHVDVLTGRDAA